VTCGDEHVTSTQQLLVANRGKNRSAGGLFSRTLHLRRDDVTGLGEIPTP
jgi:hypothetical protein